MKNSMSKNSAILVFFVSAVLLSACNQKEQKKQGQETILKGSTSIFVDETLMPVLEEQVAVFESNYEAKIKLIPKSEVEAVNALVDEKSAIAVLARKLSGEEMKIFDQKKIIPKVTKFATDGVALISNIKSNDTLVDLKAVINFMQGKSSTTIKGLVFDNPNSSTVSYMNALAGLKTIPQKGVFSFKTNDEVIKYVSENEGLVGIVGVNWLFQPMPDMQKYIDKINIMSVKGLKNENYYEPSQNNIAEGTYPLARDLYIINCQGYSGLGMGFASFVAGDIGQRIILKSGLLPVRIPARSITIKRKAKSNIKK